MAEETKYNEALEHLETVGLAADVYEYDSNLASNATADYLADRLGSKNPRFKADKAFIGGLLNEAVNGIKGTTLGEAMSIYGNDFNSEFRSSTLSELIEYSGASLTDEQKEVLDKYKDMKVEKAYKELEKNKANKTLGNEDKYLSDKEENEYKLIIMLSEEMKQLRFDTKVRPEVREKAFERNLESITDGLDNLSQAA